MTTNLLHNAIVHNVPDGGHVAVDTETGPDGVVLTVENSGEPLAAHLVATLTEPFQRATERIHGDHAGVGLGLAIVKSIVAAHDGTLTIVARPEGGLRVMVRLPGNVAVPVPARRTPAALVASDA
jgi:two-component system sensor histidine kinase VanS